MIEKSEELKARYESLAQSLDEKTTACDFNLRELEIDTAVEYMKDGDRTLDVGCGLGYAVMQYASRKRIEAHGIDYAQNMITGALELLDRKKPALSGSIHLRHASVLALPYPDNHFDVVTSSRCLMALLDWKLQQDALREICRVLKPGAILVLMEGTLEGLQRLNELRVRFGLDLIDADGSDRLFTLKFKEQELLEFCSTPFTLERIQRFGMYYFLTRIVHPLLVAPEKPKYDARINDIARQIAKVIPDFDGLGHLVVFVLRKKIGRQDHG